MNQYVYLLDMKQSLLLLFVILSGITFAQNRPQEPKEPFKYRTEDVVFRNETDSIELAGTLTLPKKGKNFPAVVFISGSGAQDRNSEILGHKPFLVIADYLTKNGVAVLRVDDRGTGKSEGNYNEASLDDFVRDTESAFDFLKSHKKIDDSRIGLVGHSLGGVIAPIIASKNDEVAFIVMLAGSGIRGDRLMLLQKEVIERGMSVPESAVEMGQKNMRGAYEIILESPENDELLTNDLETYFTEVFGGVIPKAQIETIAEQLSYPWLADFIRFDPKTALSKTNCPVLALNGSKDVQVPPTENLEAIEAALTEGGNSNVTTKELEGLNHLFQECETGLPIEYAKIEETFSPKALQIMSDWILKQAK